MPTSLMNVRYWRESGHRLHVPERLLLTQSGHWNAALALKSVFADKLKNNEPDRKNLRHRVQGREAILRDNFTYAQTILFKDQF
jgi:hypothetical protein